MGEGEEEMNTRYSYVTIVENTQERFDEELNRFGDEGYKLNRFHYRPKDDYRKQERKYIAIMWKEEWT